MNDQLPDFEPEQTSEPAAQPPKKRRKPMRRTVRAVVAPVPKRRVVKVKVKVERRGRPPGSKSKPKTSVVHEPKIPNGHFRSGAISQTVFNAILAAHNSLAALSREEKIIAARALEAMIKSVP